MEEVATLRGIFSDDAVVGDNTIPTRGYWADPSFFKLFDFPLIKGRREDCARSSLFDYPHRKDGKEIFGDKDAFGQLIKFDTTEYQVTGIMKDTPFFSHLRFEVLVSLSTFVAQDKDERVTQWTDMFATYVYCLLPGKADLTTLQSNLDQIASAENKGQKERTLKLGIQPLHEIVLGESLSNSTGPTISTSTAWGLGILASVVILSACFNYTNLSIARSLRRFKESGAFVKPLVRCEARCVSSFFTKQ
ncbi:MAG: ABC transporter permease [Bacteroidota bacterium]